MSFVNESAAPGNDPFTGTTKQARRLGLVEAAQEGRITGGRGAEAVGPGVRQFKRPGKRVGEQGPRDAVHRNRGRPGLRPRAGSGTSNPEAASCRARRASAASRSPVA